MEADHLLVYDELAEWWPVLSAPHEYEMEAKVYGDIIEGAARGPVSEILELGSGGGNNASHMKERFAMTLVDRSRAMLDVSKRLNPDCAHFEGDMRTVRLNRTFDAVFVHDAVMYLTELDSLGAAIETAYIHCRPGGVALFVPDDVRETFHPSVDHGGHDAEGRSARYLEWVFDPDPTDTTFVAEYAYVLREGDKPARYLNERHTFGLFGIDEWVGLMEGVGFDTRVVKARLGEDELDETELFIGVA